MNKKKIFVGIVGVVIVVAVVINLSIGLRSESFSYLALANIEALARNESIYDDCAKGLRPWWECVEWRDPYGIVDGGCCGEGCFPVYDGMGGNYIGCASVLGEEFCCYGK